MTKRAKWTNERLDMLLKDMNIIRLGNVINSKTKVSVKCLKDEHKWDAKPNSLSNGSGCPKCAGSIKLTNEDIDSKLLNLNLNIKRVGDYVDYFTPIEFECLVDGYRWKALCSAIYKKRSGCPRCSNSDHWTITEVDSILLKMNLKRESKDIKTSKSDMTVRCLVCQRTWISSIKKTCVHNYGCSKCAGNIILTNEEIDKRLLGRNIIRKSDYKGGHNNMDFECLTCGNNWTTVCKSVCAGDKTGCPLCCTGKGERRVRQLVSQYIKYDYLHSKPKYFNVNGKRRYPDIYLEIGNKKIIIEYNGVQHYRPVEKFTRGVGPGKKKAEEIFRLQLIRDQEMKEYWKKLNYHHLEIPYYWKEESIIEELIKISNLYN
jgi:hypothetical protein